MSLVGPPRGLPGQGKHPGRARADFEGMSADCMAALLEMRGLCCCLFDLSTQGSCCRDVHFRANLYTTWLASVLCTITELHCIADSVCVCVSILHRQQ